MRGNDEARADRGEYRMTGFALETASELILFGLVPLFLTLATVWILWHSPEPDDYVRWHRRAPD